MGRDDLVAIERSGVARPLGPASTLRLQARSGNYALLPGPEEVVFLRQEGDASRPCLIGGEIGTPGILCDVLSFIGRCNWRGELFVFSGTDQRSIYFDHGQVVGARSTVVRERLGEVLYRHGVLTREQVEQCSSATIEGRVRFGEAAVKLGFVTRERLFGLMARHVEEIAFGVMMVDAGAYYFLEGFDDAQLSSLEKLGVGELLREGVRRVHETRFFRARVPSEQHVPYRVAGHAPPTNDPLGVWAQIDGERSVADLCHVLRQGEFEVTRALFQLAQTGCVAVKAPRVAPREAVKIFNEATALVLRELDALDQGDSVRTQLASFVASRPALGRVLSGAGPADDGTLDADRVEQNLALAGAHAAKALGAQLYEYASYALFLARPHLHRVQAAPTRPRVSLRVTAMLEPIAPTGTRIEPKAASALKAPTETGKKK